MDKYKSKNNDKKKQNEKPKVDQVVIQKFLAVLKKDKNINNKQINKKNKNKENNNIQKVVKPKINQAVPVYKINLQEIKKEKAAKIAKYMDNKNEGIILRRSNLPKTPEKYSSKGIEDFKKDILKNDIKNQKHQFNPLNKIHSPQRKINKNKLIKNIKPLIKKNKILMFKDDFENTKKSIPLLKRSITSIFSPFKSYFYMEDMNKSSQKEMQDFHCVSTDINGDTNASFFSIFDGHGGTFSAKYCQNNIIKIFANQYSKNKNNILNCIIKSFSIINAEILNKINEGNDGSTASVVIIQKKKLKSGNYVRYIYTGNVGDSKIYLLQKNGNSVLLSKDHNCLDQLEVDRIKKSNGLVFNKRVFGCLAITRSIGDKEMKDYGVISEPSTFQRLITEKDNYIIIASDGIWDIVSENDLNIFGREDLGAEALCMKLINYAIKGGTLDNVSCIVVKL